MTRPVPFKAGRKPPHPESTHPRMRARAVLAGGYSGTVPASVDWYSKVVFPMDLNDQLGDCVIADEAHAVGAFTYFGSGIETVLSDSDVLAVYQRVGGYDPSQDQPGGDNPTDQGCVIQDALNDWRKNGIGTPPHKILAFFQVNHKDLAEMKACVWLFVGVTLGVNLPQSALDQFDAGQPWSYVSSADNRIVGGHDIRIIGYNGDGTWEALTWGARQKVTWTWIQAFGEEAWAEADEEIIKENAAPNGLSVPALNAAFQQLTDRPGPFTVAPSPVPQPVPIPTPPIPTPAPPRPPVLAVSAADQALAQAVPGAWLAGRHIGGNSVVRDALKSWFEATGLNPGK